MGCTRTAMRTDIRSRRQQTADHQKVTDRPALMTAMLQQKVNCCLIDYSGNVPATLLKSLLRLEFFKTAFSYVLHSGSTRDHKITYHHQSIII